MSRYVAYYRVSTAKQGRSGLGLEAQQEAVKQYLAGNGGQLVDEFTEVETGKGSNALDKRPQLQAAKQLAKKRKAVLLIAKLDRLARNVHFISGLMEDGVEFQCCDFPKADPFMLHIYAAVAEQEGRRISQRIKDALAAKRARKGPLGNAASLQPHNTARASAAAAFAAKLKPTLTAFKKQGMTQRAMLEALNAAGTRTAQGGQWGQVQLQRVLARI
jgi:DNA invertase Pin-like site-specific DNA recombinase